MSHSRMRRQVPMLRDEVDSVAKTRLERVEKFKNDAEEAARRNVASALAGLDAAQHKLTEMEDAARRTAAPAGTVAAWMFDTLDRAHDVAQARVRSAQEAVDVAARTVDDARKVHQDAHRAAKVISRVVEGRRAAQAVEDARREQARLDEFALRR